MDAVLVVGAATTGLMMASELARHGIAVRIVDKAPGIDPHVRANRLHSRTLEIFQSLGIAEKVTEGSFPERGVRVYANGKLVGESRHEPIDSPFPFEMSQSQAHTEAVLEAHLKNFGVRVERSVEFIGLSQKADRVVSTLKHADGHEEIVETPWLVGCDGAHSTVRHASGCAFPGDPDFHPYVLADVIVHGDLAIDEGFLFFHDDGELFFSSTLPEGRRLVCANMPEGQELTEPPTLEQIQALVTKRGLPDLRVSDPRWLTNFRIHYRLAPHYRYGRVFLAGDSAHVHSLLGGQGMNTGIQDAFNLGWKLALVIRELVSEDWLDSYEAERRKVGEDVVTITRAVTERAELFGKLSLAEREKLVAHMFVPEYEKMKAARHLQEVDLDYRSSPLCLEPSGEFAGGPGAGAEAPDASPIVVGGEMTTLFQLPAGTNHRLLLFNGSVSERLKESMLRALAKVVQEHGHWIDPVVVVSGEADAPASLPAGVTVIGDPECSMHERYEADSPCLYLIRPDGYVAYRSRQINSLDAYMAHVSGRHVT